MQRNSPQVVSPTHQKCHMTLNFESTTSPAPHRWVIWRSLIFGKAKLVVKNPTMELFETGQGQFSQLYRMDADPQLPAVYLAWQNPKEDGRKSVINCCRTSYDDL